MKEIDARGLACPAPVMRTRDAVEKEGATEVSVVVDNAAAQQNVQRFLESRGFAVSLGGAADALRVTGRAPAGAVGPVPRPPLPRHRAPPAPKCRKSWCCAPRIAWAWATTRWAKS